MPDCVLKFFDSVGFPVTSSRNLLLNRLSLCFQEHFSGARYRRPGPWKLSLWGPALHVSHWPTWSLTRGTWRLHRACLFVVPAASSRSSAASVQGLRSVLDDPLTLPGRSEHLKVASGTWTRPKQVGLFSKEIRRNSGELFKVIVRRQTSLLLLTYYCCLPAAYNRGDQCVCLRSSWKRGASVMRGVFGRVNALNLEGRTFFSEPHAEDKNVSPLVSMVRLHSCS